MAIDKNYWSQKLPPPYSPSSEDVQTYKKYKSEGRTLLLGCTHDLIDISDVQMDIDPWYQNESVITQDWTTNVLYYTNIIGDGVLNLDLNLANDILFMAIGCCDNLIVRYFNHKLPIMKVASNFIDPKDLSLPPDIIEKYDDYSFLIWKHTVFQGYQGKS